RDTFVLQGFVENLDDVVLVRLDELADFQRWMATQRRYVLAGHRGVIHALRGLVTHPANDRNARMAEHHQRVVEVAHHSRELTLEDGDETSDDFLGIYLSVFTGHRGLLRCTSLTSGSHDLAGSVKRPKGSPP